MKLTPKLCKDCRFLVLTVAIDPKKEHQNKPNYPLCIIKTHEHITLDSPGCPSGIKQDREEK